MYLHPTFGGGPFPPTIQLHRASPPPLWMHSLKQVRRVRPRPTSQSWNSLFWLSMLLARQSPWNLGPALYNFAASIKWSREFNKCSMVGQNLTQPHLSNFLSKPTSQNTCQTLAPMHPPALLIVQLEIWRSSLSTTSYELESTRPKGHKTLPSKQYSLNLKM